MYRSCTSSDFALVIYQLPAKTCTTLSRSLRNIKRLIYFETDFNTCSNFTSNLLVETSVWSPSLAWQLQKFNLLVTLLQFSILYDVKTVTWRPATVKVDTCFYHKLCDNCCTVQYSVAFYMLPTSSQTFYLPVSITVLLYSNMCTIIMTQSTVPYGSSVVMVYFLWLRLHVTALLFYHGQLCTISSWVLLMWTGTHHPTPDIPAQTVSILSTTLVQAPTACLKLLHKCNQNNGLQCMLCNMGYCTELCLSNLPSVKHENQLRILLTTSHECVPRGMSDCSYVRDSISTLL